MNEKTVELIAIGASVGAHCQPCLDFHIKAANKLGVDHEDIKKAIKIGHQVEKGSMAAMKSFSDSLLNNLLSSADDAKRVLKIYDPAMCCSSGVCGVEVDPELSRFAGLLQSLAKNDAVIVERYNLAQQPQAFVENETVKTMLQNGSELPFVFIDENLLCSGKYPLREELFKALKMNTTDSEEQPSKGCGCAGGSCG